MREKDNIRGEKNPLRYSDSYTPRRSDPQIRPIKVDGPGPEVVPRRKQPSGFL